MQQNLAVLALVVVLLALGRTIDRLIAYSRSMACIESGRRGCMKLEVDPPSR